MCGGCVRHSTFGSQPLCIHVLLNSASVSLLDSHTSQKMRIYMKTSGFKPFRGTYLQSAISQSLLNHILTKNRVGVGAGSGPQACPEPPRVTIRVAKSHRSRVATSSGVVASPSFIYSTSPVTTAVCESRLLSRFSRIEENHESQSSCSYTVRTARLAFMVLLDSRKSRQESGLANSRGHRARRIDERRAGDNSAAGCDA